MRFMLIPSSFATTLCMWTHLYRIISYNGVQKRNFFFFRLVCLSHSLAASFTVCLFHSLWVCASFQCAIKFALKICKEFCFSGYFSACFDSDFLIVKTPKIFRVCTRIYLCFFFSTIKQKQNQHFSGGRRVLKSTYCSRAHVKRNKRKSGRKPLLEFLFSFFAT